MAGRVATSSASDPNEESILRESGREADREAGREWRAYSIQLSIAIIADCAALLPCIVQSRERARAWRASRSKLPRCKKESTHGLQSFGLQRQAPIIPSPWLPIAVTAGQEHQDDWKSRRRLLGIPTKNGFLYPSRRETTREHWLRPPHSRFSASRITRRRSEQKLLDGCEITWIRCSPRPWRR